MKSKIQEILTKRDQLKLNTKETTDITKNIRGKLNKDDLDEVKTLTDNAVKEKPSDVKMALGPWKITQRLKVICRYVLGKFKIPDQGEMDDSQSDSTADTESTVTSSNVPAEITNVIAPNEPSTVNIIQEEPNTTNVDMSLESTASIGSIQEAAEPPAENLNTQENPQVSQSVPQTVIAGTDNETSMSVASHNVDTPLQFTPEGVNTQANPEVPQSEPQTTSKDANKETRVPVAAQSVHTQSKPQSVQNVLRQLEQKASPTKALPTKASPTKFSQKKVEYPVLTHTMAASKEGKICL